MIVYACTFGSECRGGYQPPAHNLRNKLWISEGITNRYRLSAMWIRDANPPGGQWPPLHSLTMVLADNRMLQTTKKQCHCEERSDVAPKGEARGSTLGVQSPVITAKSIRRTGDSHAPSGLGMTEWMVRCKDKRSFTGASGAAALASSPR